MTNRKMILGFILMVSAVILLLVMILWQGISTAAAATLGDGLAIQLEGGQLVSGSWRIDYQPALTEVREFPLVLENTSQESRKINLNVAEAVLTEGQLSYQALDPEGKENLSDLASIVKLKVDGAKHSSSELILEPGEEANVIIEIDSGAIDEPIGEVFGAVKITETSSDDSEKSQQVGVKMAMASIVQICLRYSAEEKTPLVYQELVFSTIDGGTVLQGEIKNPAPMLRYADVGGFEIRNATEEVVAEGELTDQFVFPPRGQTTFSWPLETVKDLASGDYQLMIETDVGTRVFDFIFDEADLTVSEPASGENLLVDKGSGSLLVIAILIIAAGGVGLGIKAGLKKK